MDEKLQAVLEAREKIEEIEVGKSKDIWKDIPWYYRLALHISNNLLIYLPLTFCLGVIVGISAG